MKVLKIAIPILIAIALVIGAIKLVKLRKSEEAKMHSALVYPLIVKTYTPQKKEVTLTLPYLAEVKNSKDTIINSKFAGKILFIKNLGDEVKKGEIVAKIDNSDLKAKLKEIDSQINSLKNKINAQNVNLKNLLATHARTKKLLDVKMASLEQYQSEESKIATLKAQIKADKNSLKALYANKKSILNNLTYTVLKSPIEGTISAKMLNKGDNAFPGKPILKVSSKKGNYLFLILPKKREEIIYKNKTYHLIPLNATFEGVKAYKANVNDPSLINGEKVNVNVVEYKGKSVTLPYNAILSINSKNYVFIPKNGSVEIKEVHILAQGKNVAAIKEDINSPVITAQPDILLKIKAGHPIKIKN